MAWGSPEWCSPQQCHERPSGRGLPVRAGAPKPSQHGGLGRRLRLAAVAAAVSGAQASTGTGGGGGIDCSAVVLTSVEVRCCEARRAWQEVAALGGCGGGGGGGASAERCAIAERFCKECSDKFNFGPTSNSSSSSSGRRSSEMVCAQAAAAKPCTLSADIGMAVVFFTGVLLLVLSSSWMVFFDFRALPFLLKRREKALTGGYAAPQPPPLPPPRSIARPQGEPPVPKPKAADIAAWKTATGVGVDSSLDGLRFVAGRLDCSPSGESVYSSDVAHTKMNSWGLPAPVTTSGSSPSTEVGSERGSSRGSGTATVSSGASPVDPALGLLSHHWGAPSRGGTPLSADPSVFGAKAMSRSSSSSSLSRRICWPARLAKVFALRTVFVWVGAISVAARGAHTIACGVLAERPQIAILLEVFFAAAPLIWCGVTSRPPATPENALPDSIAHSWPCRKVPRFVAHAVLTALFESYCTVSAAWAVAAASCSTPVWQTILLHCLGVVVAVVRVYSALLGLRLQDEFASIVRRVLPAPPAPPPLAASDIDCDLGELPDLESWPRKLESPSNSLRPRSPSAGVRMAPRAEGGPFLDTEGHSSLPALAQLPPPPQSKVVIRMVENNDIEELERRRCCSWKSIKEKCGRRLLIGFLVFVVASSTASVMVAREVVGDEEKPLPSSCLTRQNATATCVQFESIGDKFWDSAAGDTLAGALDTEEDCCTGCDELEGCQAWMFESMSRRCRLIRFQETPCKDNPGDLRCRCYTQLGTSFGFRPISQIVWIQRDGI
eukprot:TRINITY_DN80728_c0_g1_i1.p1 TRINITY_DN80728_c0_g1~~TRINITY_DN80728_c0_g1_i1.p1  ORF type:complete len:779 (+),score=170.46 TRINITY_DN80728_c0_g1_i1:139-2475(+)